MSAPDAKLPTEDKPDKPAKPDKPDKKVEKPEDGSGDESVDGSVEDGEVDEDGNPITVDEEDPADLKDCKHDFTINLKEQIFGIPKDLDVSCSKDHTIQLNEDIFNPPPREQASLIDNILYFLPLPPPVKLAVTTAKDFAFKVAIPMSKRLVPIGQKIAASPLFDKQTQQKLIDREVNKLGDKVEKNVGENVDKLNAWAANDKPDVKKDPEDKTEVKKDTTGGGKAYFTQQECSFF
jgi:hypothetical protein